MRKMPRQRTSIGIWVPLVVLRVVSTMESKGALSVPGLSEVVAL